VDADCAASGTVTSSVLPFTVMLCKAESARSADVPELPVLVVIVPVIEAGTRAAVIGTVPRAAPDCVAAYGGLNQPYPLAWLWFPHACH